MKEIKARTVKFQDPRDLLNTRLPGACGYSLWYLLPCRPGGKSLKAEPTEWGSIDFNGKAGNLICFLIFYQQKTAFFTSHTNDEFGQQEKVILFGFTFITLLLTGPGRFSLDANLQKQK